MADSEEPTEPNPFDFQTTNANYTPELAKALADLDAKIKTLDPGLAASLVTRVQEEVQKKKSANEIISTVFGILGKGVGLFL